MLGGKLRLLTPPWSFFFSLPPIFWRLLFELYMYNLHWTLLVKPLGCLVGFFFYGLIRHTISFRSWQGSASDWRQAVGSTSTMGFPPGARRLELTKKTTPGGTRGLEPTKNWVRNIDVQGGPAFQVQAINFFGGFLVYCFYSSLYFTLPVS